MRYKTKAQCLNQCLDKLQYKKWEESDM